MSEEYVYKIKDVDKITDGDTFWLYVDTGFRNVHHTGVRLNIADCPEMRGGSDYEKMKAKEAKAYTELFFEDGAGEIWIKSYKDPDVYGRWFGDVWYYRDGEKRDLAQELIELELATVWPTRWHDVYDKT